MSHHFPAIDWHTSDVATVLAAHKSDATSGLAGAEANKRLHACGPNELAAPEVHSGVRLLLDQFKDFMTVILLVAAIVSGTLGEWKDALVIMTIVTLNAAIGFTQARRADQAIAALRQLAAFRAVVLRDGQHQSIAASGLVPGDIVLLEAGNQIPADLRLLDAAQLKVDESALTGESVTVEKHTAVLSSNNLALGDRLNMAFKGTTVTHGRARGLVVATGMGTELGKVANLMGDALDRRTPLQQRLARFSKQLSFVILAICAAMFGMGLLRGENPLYMLMTVISLAVAAIPEALPAVVTVLLAIGARRMANFKALIRRLPAVETLGSVSTICSDKTGTLTQNRMHAELAWACGEPWHPTEAQAERRAPSPGHLQLLRAAALCNDAAPRQAADADTTLTWQGDPTETALAALAAQADLIKPALEEDTPRVHERPFDSGRKCMTTFHSDGTVFEAFTKGAPENVLPRCTAIWSPAGPQPLDVPAILAEADRLAAQGLRVLAFASRKWTQLPNTSDDTDIIEKDLTFIGLIGLIDPPREEAAAAVRECIDAGIRPVMITGDHPATALAIARRLGIITDTATTVLTGAALSEISDAQLKTCVLDVRIYARVDPAQKIRIVQALQSHGQFVAMTGDGVNDAPALKQADIGVAMGKGGTDVAREASSLVLLDDNFATIVAAIEEGRVIYDNLVRFIKYSFGGNLGKVLVMMLAPLAGIGAMALRPLHLLWLNLLTDGLMGLALGLESAETDVMNRPPRKPTAPILDGATIAHVSWMGAFICGASLLLAGAWHRFGWGNGEWQTVLFSAIGFAQIGQAWGLRALADKPFRFGRNPALAGLTLVTLVLQLGVIYVPSLALAFKLQPLSPAGLGATAGLGLFTFVLVHLERRRHGRRPI